MAEKIANQLIHESSPYLLQHAYNPVKWYPWGEEALKKAKESDLPILVSIGYAACHWCHVMERESFEDEDVAAYMNEHFINIKIDREERPDLDHIYMDAVQAIAGNGGWPLNVFLTSDGKPFYGGTYFPPQRAFKRLSWKEVLTKIHDSWNNRREELVLQADKLLEHISLSGNVFSKTNLDDENDVAELFNNEQCDTIAENILKCADTVYGGFGNAPKFPQTFTIQYLLAYSVFFKHPASLEQAELSLKKMLQGGIYDHLAGGLCRYSTDSHWLVPHFEKMLYDNALLVSVLSEAFQVTNSKIYEEAIHKTLDFFIREMKHPDGGFYAALDADSEHVEGKFYVWEKKEIEHIAGKDAEIYCKWFNISEKGNWDGKNILNISASEEIFALENQISLTKLQSLIQHCNEKLLIERNKRTKPGTDDKILLGWNALLITALCKSSAALGNEYYVSEAVSLFEFIEEKFFNEGIPAFHSYKNNTARHPVFLDDLAYLIQSCIHLQEITGNAEYLEKAKLMTEYVLENFENTQTGFFYFTHRDQTDVVTRKVEFYDGAVPSGNSTMVENMLYLSVVFEKAAWYKKSRDLTKCILNTVLKFPTSFAIWAGIVLKQTIGMNEIILTGLGHDQIKRDLLRLYIPNKVFQSADTEGGMALLKHKKYGDTPMIYLCKNNNCHPPTESISEMKMLLKYPII